MKKKAIFTVFCSNTPASYFPSSSNFEAFPMLLEALHPMSRAAGEPLCCVEKGTGCLCLFVFTCQIVVVWQRCFPTSLLLPLLYSGFFFPWSSRKNTNCLVCHSLGPRVGQKGASPCRVNSLSHRTPSCAQGNQLGLIRYAAPEETAILLIPRSSMHSSLKYTAHFLVICEPPFRWS